MKGPEKKRAKIAVDPSSERQMVDLQRRLLLRGGLSLGALAMLSGCRLQDGDSVDKVLWAMSRWNDRVQAWLFSRTRLAPTFDPSQVASPFPFNAFYPAYNVPEIDLPEYRLQVSGRVRDKRPWSLEQLRRLPQASQVTQLICIEGWSAIGQWSGVPLRTFLELVGADTSAKYVGFKCADRYYSSLDMPSALHPQTLLALEMSGQALPEENGYPLRLRISPSSASRTPSTWWRSSSATAIPEVTGRTRATTGSAESEAGECGLPRAMRPARQGWENRKARHRAGLFSRLAA